MRSAHVVVTEGLVDQAYVRERCEPDAFADWAAFVAEPRNSPEEVEKLSGVPAALIRAAARLYATGGNGGDLLRARRDRAQPGQHGGDGAGQPRDGDRQCRSAGTGVNPLRGQNNVQGSCDMGSFPHEFPDYRHVAGPRCGRSMSANGG